MSDTEKKKFEGIKLIKRPDGKFFWYMYYDSKTKEAISCWSENYDTEEDAIDAIINTKMDWQWNGVAKITYI